MSNNTLKTLPILPEIAKVVEKAVLCLGVNSWQEVESDQQ